MAFFRMILFYFVIYSFFGWLVEGLFNLFTKGEFTKPNFLKLPIKPMYGFAAVSLLLVYPLVPLWFFIILCIIIPTAIEYLTGVLLVHFFNLRYWDYSHKRYQYKGYVCLEFSAYWVFLAIFFLFMMQPFVQLLYTLIYPSWPFLGPVVLLLIVLDFILTIMHYKPLDKHFS